MKFNEKDLEKALKHMNTDFPEKQFTPVETYLQIVGPQISKKSMQLELARRKRLESLIVLAAYLVALISIPFFLIDFKVNGFNGITGKYFMFILGFGIVMSCCIPLMTYFLKKSAKGMN